MSEMNYDIRYDSAHLPQKWGLSRASRHTQNSGVNVLDIKAAAPVLAPPGIC